MCSAAQPPCSQLERLDRAGAQPARRLFDSHCHIIDHRFPIVPNQGYTPPNFPMRTTSRR